MANRNWGVFLFIIADAKRLFLAYIFKLVATVKPTTHKMADKVEHNCASKQEIIHKAKSDIDKFGHHVVMVNPTNYSTSFTYSIGLWKTYKHPEIICFGLRNDLSHAIINDVAAIIKLGEQIKSDQNYFDIFEDSKAMFLKVDDENIGDYFGVAQQVLKDEKFDALQIVWTDRNDKFPWEENFEEEFAYVQPLLDRNAAFKFNEPKNLTAFTSRQWLEEGKPILRVVHDTEGDWQFLTGDQMADDIRIVALEQIVTKDKSLNEVFDLDYGEEAEREIVGGKWIRTKYEE